MADNPLIASPITGEVLALNHGEWTGVYDQTIDGGEEPIPTDPTPQAVVAPFFVAPIPTTTGGAVTFNDGDWSPSEGTSVQVSIGIGTAATNFVAFASGIQATIPAGRIGRLSAVVTATFGTKVTVVFVDSGVTITEPVSSPFPADVPASRWTSEEVLTGTVSGKRRVLVSSLVTIPSGFELRWYSGPNPNPNPAAGDATTAMTPGTAYTTSGSMPVGVTCNNALFWHDTARNAWQRAHPLGQIISFVIQGIDGTPGTPSDPTFTPTVTVSTVAAVRAQFNAWNTGSQSADFVCGVNASTSGTFDLTGLQNNSAFRFWVRHVGTFTDYECSVRHSGAIRLDSSRGVYVTRMHVVTGQNEGVTMTNAARCGFDRCLLEVSRLGDGNGSGAINPQTSKPWALNVAYIHDNTDCRFSNNLIRFGLKASVIFSRCTNLRAFGNMTNWYATDDLKVWDRVDGLIFERNWAGRKSSTAAGTAPHHDWFQHQGENMHNSRFWGNVCLTGRNAWWYGPAGLGQQGFFHRPDAQNLKGKTLFISNTTWEQNIIAIDNGSIKFATPPETSQTNCSASNNTLITVWIANAFALSGVQSNSRNFIAGGNNPGDPVGIGTNGVQVAVGKGGYTDKQGVFHPPTRDYSPLANWFTFGIPLQDAAGTMSSPPETIKCIHPKAGTRLGLDNTGITLGAHIRTREIFDTAFRATQDTAAGYKVLPADVGWPVAGTWHDDFNSDDYVESTYTGSYDSNGDNA